MVQGWCIHSMKNMVRREASLQSEVRLFAQGSANTLTL